MVVRRLRPAPDTRRRRATRRSRRTTAAAGRPPFDPAAVRAHLVLRGAVQRYRTAGDQPADRADRGWAAGRRAARRGARARGSAAAGGCTARDGRAMARSPPAAILRRFLAETYRGAPGHLGATRCTRRNLAPIRSKLGDLVL